MPLKVPASLVRHLNEGRCVLFVGAGLSAQARLPSWGKLLSDLVQQVGADEQDEESTAELKKLLDAGRFLDVADECKERLGSGYAEFLSKALQVGAGPVPEAHRLVMQLPFAAWITTNYDKLLEQSHFQVRGSVPKTLTHLDADTFGTLLFDGAPFILKAHGDVDKPESLIFTTRDYREIIHSNPAFQAVFSAILLTRAVLFVGYSLNDPDFRLLLDRQLTMFKKFVPERYAIMAGVGEVEREVLRRTAQIKVLSYPAGQHEQLVEFLRALQAQVAGNQVSKEKGGPPAPPEEQAKAAKEAFPLLDALGAEAEDAPPQPQARGAGDGGRAPAGVDLKIAPPSPPRATTAPPVVSAPRPPPPAAAPAAVKPGGLGGEAPRPAAAAPPPVPIVLDEPEGAALVSPATRPFVLTLKLRGDGVEAAFDDEDTKEIAWRLSGTFSNSSLMKLLAHAGSVPDYRRIGRELTGSLHPSVLNALERHVSTASSPSLILQLDAELESKPWELMEVLGKPLALQAAVSRTPVGLTSAARGRPMFREPVRALLIGDPTGNLPVARAEVEEIAKLYHKPIVLIGDDANAEDVGEVTLRGCDVIHFAGSAWCDSQDMYLVLAGGTHLTDDLIRPGLSHRPPCVVMLNSHYTAFVPPGVGWKGPDPMKATSGGRMGFTEVMMRAGVGVFVGCFGAPSDTGGAAVALAFHRALLTGVSAAEALRRARNAPTVPKDDPTPLLYSLSGYGDLALE